MGNDMEDLKKIAEELAFVIVDKDFETVSDPTELAKVIYEFLKNKN